MDNERKLRNKKAHSTRRENWEYLNSHPEVRGLLRDFIQLLLAERPKDFRKFVFEYFSQDKKTLAKKINKRVEELKEETKKENCSSDDEEEESGHGFEVI